MSLTILSLTCCCGARLDFTTTYNLYAAAEREAFSKAHEVCRERERPLVMWGGDQA